MHSSRSEAQELALGRRPSGDGDTASRLDTFPSEVEIAAASTRIEAGPAPSRIGIVALALALLIGVASLGWFRSTQSVSDAGSLRIETDAEGADVTIDGSYRGRTPVLLSLAPGTHTVLVQQGTFSRTLEASIADRTTVVHHISWPAERTTQTTGGIEISSDPRGQRVSVDGQPRGVTPVTVAGLAPGTHDVVIRRDSTAVRRAVQVEAGTTASLMVTMGAQGVSSGWLNVSAPVPVQIYEGAQLIGSSESERILVPAGTHTYDLVNAALGFRTSQAVQVTAGQTSSIAVPLPHGTISVNAMPWAQVWLDGQPLGETPLGNVAWTIGAHELILRHPELGERRVTTTITTGDPTRVAVDMRKPQ